MTELVLIYSTDLWHGPCLKKKKDFNALFPTESEWYLNTWVHFQFTYDTVRSFYSTEAETFHQKFYLRFRFSKALLFPFNMADAIKQILHRSEGIDMHMNKCIILTSHSEWYVSRRYRDNSNVHMTRSRLHMMIIWDQSTWIETCIRCFQAQFAVENWWSILKENNVLDITNMWIMQEERCCERQFHVDPPRHNIIYGWKLYPSSPLSPVSLVSCNGPVPSLIPVYCKIYFP